MSTTHADIARRIASFRIISRGHPYPGQHYRHGWIPVAGSLPDYLSRVDALASSWRTGEAPNGRQQLAGGKMGDTFLVVTNDGRKVVEKRSRFNREVNPLLSEKDMADHEQMMGDVGHLIGVPTAAVHRIDDNTVILDYQEGTPAPEWEASHTPLAGLAHRVPDQTRLLGFMDVLTQNGDRHAGNYVINDTPHGPLILPIDHGNAFSGVERDSSRDLMPLWVYSNPEMAEPFSRGLGVGGVPERGFYSDGLALAELEAYRSRLKPLGPRWQAMGDGPERQYKLMMERLDAMIDDAKSKARRQEFREARGMA